MTVQTAHTDAKDMLYGFWTSQCLSVVASLGIADFLRDGPKSSEELAVLADCHAPSLYRLLRALSGAGIFKEDQHARFSLTPISNLLRTDVEDSIDPEVKHLLHPSNWAAWGQLLHCIRTGEAAFPKVFTADVWKYRAEHPEVGAIFDRMASAKSKQDWKGLIDELDFSGVQSIVDVGGGNGAFLAEILRQQQHIRGTLFEQPHVVVDAGKVFEAAGVLNRATIVPGNFFEDVPAGCEMYLLKAIIHNWGDQAAVTILKTCRRAMSQNARIVIVESVIEPGNGERGSPVLNQGFMDLHMLVIHGGRERTAEEFRNLLAAANFNLTSIVKTRGGVSLIEGAPR